MPTVTTPLPHSMTEKQRATLLAETDRVFKLKIVCGDHLDQRPQLTIEGDRLSIELCCENLAALAKLSLPKILKTFTDRA